MSAKPFVFDTDVLIIGGGFSGINTALELAEQGITNVVVLEAQIGRASCRERV